MQCGSFTISLKAAHTKYTPTQTHIRWNKKHECWKYIFFQSGTRETQSPRSLAWNNKTKGIFLLSCFTLGLSVYCVCTGMNECNKVPFVSQEKMKCARERLCRVPLLSLVTHGLRGEVLISGDYMDETEKIKLVLPHKQPIHFSLSLLLD